MKKTCFGKQSFTRRGFTLVEVLVAVMIVTILVTMAVPMYERTVEKSRVAEVSMTLKRLSEAKLRVMDNKNISTFNGAFGLDQLDMERPKSKDFTFYLYPRNYPNAVCAVRARGENAGTKFLFLGETAPDYCDCNSSYSERTVCGDYCGQGRKLFCQDVPNIRTSTCDAYSMDSYDVGSCG